MGQYLYALMLSATVQILSTQYKSYLLCIIEYVKILPPDVIPYLDKQLDWDSHGVDKDLNIIADHMIEWEEKQIPMHLKIENNLVHDIKETYKGQPQLQR